MFLLHILFGVLLILFLFALVETPLYLLKVNETKIITFAKYILVSLLFYYTGEFIFTSYKSLLEAFAFGGIVVGIISLFKKDTEE
ncbi:hypothetical protein LC087_10165 [Bacillus carboniphilus]|uniref:Uncharacterized protein n=1 Tax=Bacillus carboniphilus TaxID=86663 RepID=A0ABY9JSA6_9BACI|nr:hypothetical protein [Bacillus carboniphilus]WLR41295.1 hypothetical protein LC087_10165 [Bacillus carboniphilus]